MIDHRPQPYEAPSVEEVDSGDEPIVTSPGVVVS